MTIVSSTTPRTSLGPVEPVAGTPLIELRHMDDPLDRSFARLAAEHGDKVSTLADYPEWARQFDTAKETRRG